jgi:hypothetical protein
MDIVCSCFCSLACSRKTAMLSSHCLLCPITVLLLIKSKFQEFRDDFCEVADSFFFQAGSPPATRCTRW